MPRASFSESEIGTSRIACAEELRSVTTAADPPRPWTKAVSSTFTTVLACAIVRPCSVAGVWRLAAFSSFALFSAVVSQPL